MKKIKLLSLILMFSSVVPTITSCATDTGKQKKPWNEITNYVCYYGGPHDNMKQFDVAIFEPRNFSVDQIKELNDSGVYTIGYVSIGEDDTLNVGDGKGPGGYASYYFNDGEGMPLIDENWNSYFVNANNPLWHEVILERAKEIMDKGCDGLFLDQPDTVDVFPETKDGMVSLIKELRDVFPDKKIVLNRGFTILRQVVPYLSGLMYEDVYTTYDFENGKYVMLDDEAAIEERDLVCAQINYLRKTYDFPVFGLDYTEPSNTDLIQQFYNALWEYNFIPYVSTILLDNPYIHDITPTSERGIKANITEDPFAPEVELPPPSTDKNNIALACNGTKVSADSNYEDYTPSSVNDGYRNLELLPWSLIAWASAETPQDHWLEFIFTKDETLKNITIYWALDSGKFHSSKKVVIQKLVDSKWVTFKAVDINEDNIEKTTISLNNLKTSGIRITQPAGKGETERPNLMWVAEVEIY